MKKYDNDEETMILNPFEDSLSALVFEMNQILANNTIGFGLLTSLCFNQKEKDMYENCELKLEETMSQLSAIFNTIDASIPKIRKKRGKKLVEESLILYPF